MKRYIFFSVSFILLFWLFHVLTGMILTWMYAPNAEEFWHTNTDLSQETVLQTNSSTAVSFVISFLAASIAYVISSVFGKKA